MNPANWSTFSTAAAPIIRSEAARLTRRMGLRPGDREDLEQELWLHLLLWWGDASASGSFQNNELTALQDDLSRRVRRLADLFARSGAFRRRFASQRECSSSHWLESVIATGHQVQAQRLSDLHLDVIAVLTQLPSDLREMCERLLRGKPVQAGLPFGSPLTHRHVAALRRVFRSHGLHEYL